jgi:uncharacterized membrane protein
VEVTTEACVEFLGSGTNRFDVTIYNREDYPVVYYLVVSGGASEWATTSAPSVRVGGLQSEQEFVEVDVPQGTEPGLYNLTLEVASGTETLIEKELFVSVSEEPAGGGQNQTVSEIVETPAGAFVAGDIGLTWVNIGAVFAINLILAVILVQKHRGR